MHLREPKRAEYMPWLETGLIKMITLAPEIAGGEALMREALAQGATVSIGHSGADYDAATRYFAAGARQVTHTFNGMPGIHHRQPGLFVAALENPDVTFQIIADGIHVHPAVVRLLARLVGMERVVVITDAMLATGLGDGQYLAGDAFVTGQGRSSEDGSRRLGWQHIDHGARAAEYHELLRFVAGGSPADADARSGAFDWHVSAEGLAAGWRGC